MNWSEFNRTYRTSSEGFSGQAKDAIRSTYDPYTGIWYLYIGDIKCIDLDKTKPCEPGAPQSRYITDKFVAKQNLFYEQFAAFDIQDVTPIS